jgi:hypothetical protein
MSTVWHRFHEHTVRDAPYTLTDDRAAETRANAPQSTSPSQQDQPRTEAIEEQICITSGCVCYTGQGYSGCVCPGYLEVTITELAKRETWSYEDIRKLQKFAKTRQVGRIVKWFDYEVKGPCSKGTPAFGLLEKFTETHRMLYWNEIEAPQFSVAFYLFDDFRVCNTNDLASLFEQFDTWEGLCRAFITGVLVIDHKMKTIDCFYAQDGVSCRPGDWTELTQPSGRFHRSV